MKKFELPNLINELDTLVLGFLKSYKTHKTSNKIFKIKSESDPNALFSSAKALRDLLPGSDTGMGGIAEGRSFKIGDVVIKNPVISAPLAGISDNTYRIFARSFGSALTYTEMVTSYGIYYRHKKSLSLANITDHERPCALQIFGSDPVIIAEAAGQIENAADIIDINMGCPVAKVLKAGSGGYLIQDEKKVEKVLAGLSSVLKKPFTVKTRIGWDRNNINILKIAKIAESRGASAISIHGRTVKQKFTGEVDYKLIKEVKERIKIPVIVSGDINSPAKAKEVFEYTGCDGIMIGRAAKGRLWVFTDILLFILGYYNRSKDTGFDPGTGWKKEFSKLYLKFLVYFKGENKAVREFRKHLSWIFRGTRGISRARRRFFEIEDMDDAENSIDNI